MEEVVPKKVPGGEKPCQLIQQSHRSHFMELKYQSPYVGSNKERWFTRKYWFLQLDRVGAKGIWFKKTRRKGVWEAYPMTDGAWDNVTAFLRGL